jgi:hypothetical protein
MSNKITCQNCQGDFYGSNAYDHYLGHMTEVGPKGTCPHQKVEVVTVEATCPSCDGKYIDGETVGAKCVDCSHSVGEPTQDQIEDSYEFLDVDTWDL